MKFLIAVLIAASLLRCNEDVSSDTSCHSKECSITATVKDLSGLDGCGVVLELADGTRLIPERRVYVQAPKPSEDPLYYFELKPNDVVRISYEESTALSACMAGKIVFITCIASCKANTD